ncbi:uncharacterized protein MONBRDRAFT_22960 [Monosiga brevicollis MX1]|uniref:EF-hand domain-containing protein n=1 Tax=Monosiga brevicollis TaxID=81824 RepID=A9USL1_MONBE|nr:uncharacterized protein MONBRDRAFT_22960 [Monosiga brevicollis MX1]EDQ91798.1 predicted protein [Monosiga brevicollis MX1]|eukprot:XP_001743084.1 hypothetical protein [Monosiga brevicollis MX1]
MAKNSKNRAPTALSAAMEVHPRPEGQLTARERLDLREVFDLSDMDGSNTLDWIEVRRALRGIGFPITKREAQDLVRSLDGDDDGFLNFDEFADAVLRQSRSSVRVERELRAVYKHLARGPDDTINLDALRQLSQELNESLSRTELEDMIRCADSNGDGLVDFADFTSIMLRTSVYH